MPRRPARKRRSRRISKSKKKALRKEKLKKAFLVALLFITSFLFLSGYTFYKQLTSEYASAFSPSSYSILDRSVYSTALIVVEDFSSEPVKIKRVSLYIIDKNTLKLVNYEIPPETQIDVPGRFGLEPFSNIFALGNLEEKELSDSAQLVSQAIFKLFAFPVDRYILVESRGEETITGLLLGDLSLKEKDTYSTLLKESVKTNLDLREFFDLYTFTRSIPEDRMIKKDLGNSYLENINLLDEELKDLTFDTYLSSEGKSIAVLNGTEVSGLANFASRAVENYGGRVVAIANAESIYEESVLIVDETTSESTRIIANLFGIDNILLKSEILDVDEDEIARSDVTVILGLDFAGSL